ncbi:hypothetical protein H0H93_007744 [Arthromyces matolae]|nr:hypothetical protein H0H93_007744 [Arthromyces matolae]
MIARLRTVLHHYRTSSPPTDPDVELQDDAEASANPETLVTQQYVSVKKLPLLEHPLLTNRLAGSPLTLTDLVRTTLFRPFAFENTELSTFGITRPDSSFPILSQGEHPTLGTPCWYLHPCATDAAVTELMTENEGVAHEAVIVAATRTPVGSLNGSLKSFTAPQLGSIALKAALQSKQIDPALVEEVYFGNVVQAGVGQNPARQVALNSGLKPSSDATTINKVCASGLKSIIFAAQSIQSGDRQVVAAGGMESMSHAPFLIPRQNPAFGKFTAIDSLENDGLWDVYNNFAMGNCGESAAVKHEISRESQDGHAIESYKRADRAWKSGAFDAEVVPVTVKGKKGDTIVKEDEEYTRVIFDKVPTLRSAFKQGGTITAANSSPLSDGASALILMSAEKAKELGLTPLAKIISWADAGVEPIDFPEAPTVALPQALKKANLTVDDISLFEINEAFSVVVRIAEKVLNVDPAKVNVNGGAVALGHAIGNSGARIIVSLVHALKSGQYGAAGICNGKTKKNSIFLPMTPSTEPANDSTFNGQFTDEKAAEITVDIYEGDEALQLIGAQRSNHFSDEYNSKLRRKLGVSFTDDQNLPPYKIIYILLGGLAILVGVSVLVWLPDSPVHATFLTKEERVAALERVRDDQGGTRNSTLKKSQIIEAITDIRTWLIVLSTLLTFLMAVLATNERMIPIMFAVVPTIVGAAILIGLNGTNKKGALLFGIYIIGTFGSALSIIYAWNASNTSGHTKKSTINALTLTAFGLGNVIGTEIFQPKDAPNYVPGKIAIMILLVIQLAVCILLRWINLRLNAKKLAQIEEMKARKGWTDADIQRERERHAFADLTDKE